MKILVNILKVLGVILLLLIVVSFFLPSKVHVERSMTMNASPDVIFAELNSLKNWPKWSPWNKHDPAMVTTYEGPESGVGAKSVWKSEKLGDGSMVITESRPNELLVTEIDMGFGKSKGSFKLDKMGDSTRVTWSLDSEGEGMPFWMKIPAKYMNLAMDKMMGRDFENGLTDLKAYAEKQPKAQKEEAPAMPKYVVEEVKVDKQLVLAAPDKTVAISEVQGYLAENLPKLFSYAAKNGAKPGPPTAIYYTFDGKQTRMEAVLPINKKIKEGDGMKVREMPATNALKVMFYGDYKDAGAAHASIDQYAKEKDKKINGAPWEVYVTDPGMEKDTTKWLTEIYYPIE